MFGKRQNLPATCRFTFADGRHRRMRPHTPPSAVSASTMALSAPRASGQYNLLREIAPRANARRRLSPGLPPTGSWPSGREDPLFATQVRALQYIRALVRQTRRYAWEEYCRPWPLPSSHCARKPLVPQSPAATVRADHRQEPVRLFRCLIFRADKGWRHSIQPSRASSPTPVLG
jgi:hypothetical protein